MCAYVGPARSRSRPLGARPEVLALRTSTGTMLEGFLPWRDTPGTNIHVPYAFPTHGAGARGAPLRVLLKLFDCGNSILLDTHKLAVQRAMAACAYNVVR